MQAVILAAGLGTRLRPITDTIPKSMVPVKGKPFLEYQINLLKKNNINNIVICIAYLGEKIEDYFGDGKKFGVSIVYAKEKSGPNGTGAALKNAEYFLEKEFLLLNGDTFLDIDYQSLVLAFKKSQKTGMTVVFKNQPKIAKNNMEVGEDFEILNYNKAAEGRANYVDAGVHAFKKNIVDFIPHAKFCSLEEEILPILIAKKQLVAYPVASRYYDIGTPERLKKFEETI
jgi:NDP-sugar pyrophosphorylase family protein